MYGSGLDGAFTMLIVAAGIAGAAVMALLFWVAPWLWGVIKPWLHLATA